MAATHTTTVAPATHRILEQPCLEPGDLILGEFEVIELAGIGATSHVYRCRPCATDALPPEVAVKVLHRDLVDDPRVRRRFLREARLMQRLAHPNIVRVFQVIDTPGLLAFVMEHVPGPSLRQWLDEHPPGMDPLRLTLVLELLDGLGYAHHFQIVHRDLKPTNILLDLSGPRPRPRIIDFGLARLLHVEPDQDELETIRGTAAYISPDEIRSPLEVCPQSDLYSMGIMLYEMVTGERPFANRGRGPSLLCAHLVETPPAPSELDAPIPPALEDLILALLAKTPQERPTSAEALGLAMVAACMPARQDIADIPIFVDTPQDMQLHWLAAVQLIMLHFMTLVLSPGVTGRLDDPHYLSRPHQDFPSLV